MTALVDNLQDYAEEEAAEEEDSEGGTAQDDPPEGKAENADGAVELPDGAGKMVLCVGGRGELDDAAAAMLAQVLTAQGATARMIEHHTWRTPHKKDWT